MTTQQITIDMPEDMKPECWHQYDRHQKAWLVWKPQDCKPGTDLHELAAVYASNPKLGRKKKPPMLVWQDGTVRIQFVGNFENATHGLRSVRADRGDL